MAKQDVEVQRGGSPSTVRSRWLRPFEEMERELDQFFPRGWLRGWPQWDRWLPMSGGGPGGEVRMPSMDIIDRDKEMVIRAEMPGLAREDITIDVSDHMLTIRGERKQQTEEREEGYYRREIGTVAFARSLSLPEEVEADGAKAAYRDGVLEVTLPKKAPSARKTLKVE